VDIKGKKISITCKGVRTVPYTGLVPFQGNLKTLSEANASHLRESILKYGWAFPVFVWKDGGVDYIHDGHGRIEVLKGLIADGYTIGEIPVVDIEADDKTHAGVLLLAVNSKYGEIVGEGLYEFLHDKDIDPMELEMFDLPDIDLGEFRAEFFEHGDLGGGEDVTPENKPKACPQCGYQG